MHFIYLILLCKICRDEWSAVDFCGETAHLKISTEHGLPASPCSCGISALNHEVLQIPLAIKIQSSAHIPYFEATSMDSSACTAEKVKDKGRNNVAHNSGETLVSQQS